MKRDFDIAYFAGLFDGEGSFSIQVRPRSGGSRPHLHFNPRMTMTLKYGTEVLDELCEVFGGKVYNDKHGMKKWCLAGRVRLILATKSLLPYLRIKRRIGERFLEALELVPVRVGRPKLGEHLWTKEVAARAINIALTLNPRPKSPTTITDMSQLLSVLET
jgi:hypothetical protein